MQSGLKRFLLVGIALLINLTFTVTAQDEPSPLLSVFSQIPYTAQALGNWGDRLADTNFITYTDIDAITDAYPEMERVSMFDVPRDQMTDAQYGWIAFLTSDLQLPSDFGRAMLQIDAEPALGIDLFTAKQVVSYGTPPRSPLFIFGEWDNELIRPQLDELGYAPISDEANIELWCATEGCVEGGQLNPDRTNTAHPFGGQTGRLNPIVLGDGFIWGSNITDQSDLPLIVRSDDHPTLADQPRYQAMIDGLTHQGVLLQAMIFDGGRLLMANSLLAPGGFSERDFDSAGAIPEIPAEQAAYNALLMGRAGYELMAWGDVVTEDSQVFRAVLVYSDVESAESVRQTIDPAFAYAQTQNSIRTNQAIGALFSDRRITSVTAQVVESEGYGVLVVDVSTPKATLEQFLALSRMTLTSQDIGVTRPSLLYRLFTQSLYSNDYNVFGWLTGAGVSETFILEMVELGILGEEAQQALEEFNAAQDQ